MNEIGYTAEAIARRSEKQIADLQTQIRTRDPEDPGTVLGTCVIEVLKVALEWSSTAAMLLGGNLNREDAVTQIQDAIARGLLTAMPQCIYPGCKARYDADSAGTDGGVPGAGLLTGWRWLALDGDEADELPEHDHSLTARDWREKCPHCDYVGLPTSLAAHMLRNHNEEEESR